MKKVPNDTDFLLHPSENEDPKELPDLLSYKTCTAYMGNLKITFMDKFRENTQPLVFKREHWSRILSTILSMKTEYCRKHNIRLVNPKQRAGQWIYVYILFWCAMKCIIVMVVFCILWLSLFNNDIIILNFLCNCYASYAYPIYILILIDDCDRTAVGYACLWEGKPSGSSFLHLFNACYHMVGRSSEVSL